MDFGKMGQQGQPVTPQDVQQKIDQLYGDTHAKNVGQGLLKGVVSVGKGVFAGVGGLIAAPVIGAAHEGGKGFLKGAAVGVTGLLVLPTIGIVQGVRQVGSGIKNTPEAVKEMMKKDKKEEAAEAATVVDDAEADSLNERSYSDSRVAVEEFAFEGSGSPNLGPQPPPTTAGAAAQPDSQTTAPPPASTPAASAASAASATAAASSTVEVKETELYEVLGVSVTATSVEIKKAYYKLARECHPDKNPGDEKAKARFQCLGEAYQTLMDPDKRALYDKHGRASLDGNFMDPSQFFTMAFGAEKFKPLIGELTVAYTAAGDVTPQQVQEWQKQREAELARVLLDRLQPWLLGDEEKFVEDTLRLVEELKDEAFSAAIFHCIGYTYYHRAEVCLGLESMLGVPGYINAVKQYGHDMSTRYKAVDAAVRIGNMKSQLDAGGSATEDTLPMFLNAIWLISALDIESTLRHVVELVVKDKSVNKDERKRRASGIMRFGKIFLAAGSEPNTTKEA